jgi:outer membrane protein assembly factor BamE (lipoprotein component of BamABCDE complex)
MKKVVIISILGLFIAGCVVGGKGRWTKNRENLNEIEISMSKAEVREIMGKPYRREAKGELEWWLYETEYWDRWQNESDYLTPLLFENGKLVGWGKNYWTTKEQKYDVKIDQRIKQE